MLELRKQLEYKDLCYKNLQSNSNWAYERVKVREENYKQALGEIEEYCIKQIRDMNLKPFRKTEEDILDIINKTKEQ